MDRAFDLLAKLPNDFFADEREDSSPQEREDSEDSRDGHDKSDEEN